MSDFSELKVTDCEDAISVGAQRGSPTPSQVLDSSAVEPADTESPTRQGDPTTAADAECIAQVKFETIVADLVELGFDEYICEIATRRTKGSGIEEAIAWIIDHSNESDVLVDTISSDDGEMGGAVSQQVETVVGVSQRMLAGRFKMVFVVNMGLKMGTGKVAAQVGHATLAVYRKAMEQEEGQAALNSWLTFGQVKIVLKGNDTEHLLDLFKTGKDAGCYCYVVQDAGRTQIAAGSHTVLGIFGECAKVDSVTGGLRLL